MYRGVVVWRVVCSPAMSGPVLPVKASVQWKYTGQNAWIVLELSLWLVSCSELAGRV